MKVMTVFGTRPEAIKMCPLVKELDSCPQIESTVCLTGQHREMLQQVINIFGTRVNFALDIMRPGQSLSTITCNILERFETPLHQAKPDIVLVHGDTTTSFVAALASFYHQVPVGHVEAGLRTGNPYSPFPEEMNRSLTGRIAALHFAPTEGNRQNLAKENITQGVFVTGNTVIDAFKTTLQKNYTFHEPALAQLDFSGKRLVLLTVHRRENLGQPMEDIFEAVRQLHDRFQDIQFVYPMHLNPRVQQPARRLLGGLPRVLLTAPLDVRDMHNLISRSFLVMTDSGGLQEEAPYCGVPVLVLRTETERPEAVAAGTVRVVGVQTEDIVAAATLLATNKAEYERMAKAVNPYGDGHASARILQHLLDWDASRHAAGEA